MQFFITTLILGIVHLSVSCQSDEYAEKKTFKRKINYRLNKGWVGYGRKTRHKQISYKTIVPVPMGGCNILAPGEYKSLGRKGLKKDSQLAAPGTVLCFFYL